MICLLLRIFYLHADRYIIHSWSIKLNITTDLYTLRLTLERISGQRSMDDVMKIPKPSDLDDWKLYEQLERDRIRDTEGKVRFDDWSNTRNAEKLERDYWRYSREFKIRVRDFDAPEGQSPPRRRKLSDIDTDLLPPWEVSEEED